MKSLLEQESRNKEVEKEIREKLEDSVESHEIEVDISNSLREELSRSKVQDERMQKEHSGNNDKITKLGIEAVRHQSEKDQLATKIYDMGVGVKNS